MSKAGRLAVPCLLLAAPALFFHEICLQGRAPLMRDLFNWFYPWRELARQSLAEGEIPLWNPYSFMGTPFLANMQSGLLYPLNVPFWILDFPSAMRLFLVLQFGATAWMMHALMRRLGCRAPSSLLAGIGFAYGGWMLVHLEFPNKVSAVSWLPLVILGMVTWWDGRPLAGLAMGGAGVALSITAGYPQTSMTIVMAAAVMWTAGVAFRLRAGARRSAVAALSLPAIVALGSLIAAAQLLPFQEAAALSERAAPRTTTQVLTRSLEPAHFISLALPHLFGAPGIDTYWGGNLLQFWLGHFYVGLPILLVAPLALKRAPPGTDPFRARRWAVPSGLALLAIGALLSLGSSTPFARMVLIGIPLLTNFRWFSTNSILIAFALCWLAALGMDRLIRIVEEGGAPARRLAATWLVVAAVAVGCAAAAIASPSTLRAAAGWAASWVMLKEQVPAFETHGPLVRGDLVRAAVIISSLAGLALAVARGRLSASRFVWAVPAILFLDLFAASAGIIPTGDPALYRDPPATLPVLTGQMNIEDRIYVPGDTQKNDVLMYGQSQESWFRWASEIFLVNLNLPHHIFSASGGDPVRPIRTASWLKEIEETDDRERARRLLAASNVSRIVLGSPGERSEVSDVPGVLPRARVVPGARKVGDAQAMAMIALGLWDPSRETLVGDDFPGVPRPPAPPLPHTIHAIRHTRNTAVIDVESEGPGYLVFTDAIYPGWEAAINDRPAPMFTADHLFRGVDLPPGRSQVTFAYRPARLRLGAALSAIGLGLLAALLALDRRFGPTASP